MNEASLGFAGAADGGGSSGGDSGQQLALQTRAAFLKNWSWQSVTSLNQAACTRGGAQHGSNPQAQDACRQCWEETRLREASLSDTLDFLRENHRRAPFLFFNGNTFADIGRRTCDALFSELPSIRRRELSSAVAHYIAGVLDRESMISAVNSLCESASLIVGDRVETLRGSLSGVIIRILEDGRVSWKPDTSNNEFIGLPESLRKIKTDWGEN